MKRVDRRSLLRSCAAAALFSMMPDMALASSRLDVGAFLQKSRELTGKSNLDPVLASAFYHAFRAQAGD
ncbi:MAG: sugar dehydrogenase complex small subunit, partial [Pseudomonadota bacterium]